MTAITSKAATKPKTKKKSKPKLLGYGLFVGVYWGSAKKAWTLERGMLRKTRKEAGEIQTDHCLSREVRPVHTNSRINIGHHSHPQWVRGEKLEKPA